MPAALWLLGCPFVVTGDLRDAANRRKLGQCIVLLVAPAALVAAPLRLNCPVACSVLQVDQGGG